jgi:uncharacterized membrane protein
MLFKILVILHTLGATVWTGGHLVLAATVLPQALKNRNSQASVWADCHKLGIWFML